MSKEKNIETELLNQLDISKKYLVAVSGGIDSMVLLFALKQCNFKISVAHCNYQLRGEESNADEQLVFDFCTKWQIPFYSKRFDTEQICKDNKSGIQETARNLRYSFFNQICIENGLDVVLTAHHANDQLETVLMAMSRGAGLNGICGIKKEKIINNLLVIRPLLNIDKVLIQEFQAVNNIPFRDDASNNKLDYTRNKIRHLVIPALQNTDERFFGNMLYNIQLWNHTNQIYETLIAEKLKNATSQRGRDLYLHINSFKKLKPIFQWLWETLKPFDFSFGQCQEIEKLMQSTNGKFVANNNFRVVKQNEFLIVTKNITQESNYILVQYLDKEIQTSDFKLQFSKAVNNLELNKNENIAFINAKKINYPLVIRKWKMGDYFYPLGMEKKKKIARFLIDNKVPLIQKEKTWVVESNGKIVWVIGKRLDNRFKVTENTKELLVITIQ